jgi:hypothetical protein
MAELMEYNYLLEHKALVRAADGARVAIDFARIPDVLAALSKELLEIEATGDRARAEAWFARYDKMPPAMGKVLESAADVPVDIDPIFSFADKVR